MSPGPWRHRGDQGEHTSICGQRFPLCRAAAASAGLLALLPGGLATPLLCRVGLDDGGCRPVLLLGQGDFAPGRGPAACRGILGVAGTTQVRAATARVALTPGLSVPWGCVGPTGAGSAPLHTSNRVLGPGVRRWPVRGWRRGVGSVRGPVRGRPARASRARSAAVP